MKKRYIYFLLLLLISLQIEASEQKQTERVKCLNARITPENDSIRVHIVFELDHDLSGNESIEITPWLSGAEHTYIFPSLLICGKNKYKLNKRSYDFMSAEERMNYKLHIGNVRIDRRKSHTEIYESMIPSEEWMTGSTLGFSQHTCNCGSKKPEIRQSVQTFQASLDPEDLSRRIQDQATLITINEVPEKINKQVPDTVIRIYKGCFLYPKSKSDPDFDFANNAEFRNELIKLTEESRNQQIIITGVRIDGFASPEGIYLNNEALSRDRSSKFERMLKEQFHIPFELIKSNYHGEDWKGLIELIKNSQVDYQTRVLEIIDSTGIFKGREKELMLLDQGKPYLQMKESLFPALRRVDFEINYKTTTIK